MIVKGRAGRDVNPALENQYEIMALQAALVAQATHILYLRFCEWSMY